VSLSDGAIKAIGKRQGAAVCEFDLPRPGPAVRLRLITDATTLAADGQDVANVEVDVVDAAGNIVTGAADAVTCSIDGPGNVLAIENGDIASQDANKIPTHKVFNGRALIYIQSEPAAGKIVVTVTAPNLEPATASIEVK
jgi:beta-galactosidase